MNPVADPPEDPRLRGWLRLARCPGLAVRDAAKTAALAGGAAAFAAADVATWRELGIEADVATALGDAALERQLEEELQRTAKAGWLLIHREEPLYPGGLLELAVPPPVIAVKGDCAAIAADAVAIVGARAATDYGLRMAKALAGDVAACGLTIASGLARGVDGAAHRGALDAGGRTLAVMGTGIARVYPAEHRALAEAIAGSGALVTEFAPDEPPLPHHFPRRNRLIAGLSWAVVVVEAGRRSGSLSTARWAVEQGRAVLAVPGRVGDAGSEGPLALLRDGAAPAMSAADIWGALPAAVRRRGRGPEAAPGGGEGPPDGERSGAVLPPGLPVHCSRLLAAFPGPDPVHLDQLLTGAQVTTEQALGGLFSLQLLGLVASVPGGRYRRLPGGRRPRGG